MSEILETQYVKQTYQEIAPHFSSKRAISWNWIEDFLDNFTPTTPIGDLGCGGGRCMRLDWNFIGIDNCHKFIDICQEKGLNAQYGELIDLPLETNELDVIISIASFHHLATNERRIMALKEMKRVSKSGGKILISVWSVNQPKESKRKLVYGNNIVPYIIEDGKARERYYYVFEKKELENLFLQVGFKIIDYQWNYGNEIYYLEA